jgi:hypothetical protein
MDLATIEMPEAEAKARLKEYQAAAAEERNALDERIAAGYRALARGLPVIRLSQSVAAGGWFDNGLPRIAVVRATARECWVEVENTSLIYLSEEPGWWGQRQNRGALVNASTVRVAATGRPEWFSRRVDRGQTLVPIIPPQHRPNRRRLHRFHILWEVEQWTWTAPRDPALLRFIGGDLWAVAATWDLTELERAVLET